MEDIVSANSIGGSTNQRKSIEFYLCPKFMHNIKCSTKFNLFEDCTHAKLFFYKCFDRICIMGTKENDKIPNLIKIKYGGTKWKTQEALYDFLVKHQCDGIS